MMMILKIKFVDPDGEFLVLSVSDEKNLDAEILIDKHALRFVSNKAQSAIPANMVEAIQLKKSLNSLADLNVAVLVKEDREWNDRVAKERLDDGKAGKISLPKAFVKDLGIMPSLDDQRKFKEFLSKMNFQVIT